MLSEQGERNDHQRHRGNDGLEAPDVEVSHQPAGRPIGLCEVGDVLHEHDQRGEERVERHTGEQQHRRRHRPPVRRGQPVDDASCDGGSGKAGKRYGGERSRTERNAKDDHEHRAERCAGGDAQGERRRQRIAKEGLKDHAGRGERRADKRCCENSRQSGDEEDLGVDVVGERN
jgi:hypothetical protein